MNIHQGMSLLKELKSMEEKNNLLEKSLDLFSLNKIDRDIYTWTGKNVGWARVLGGK